MRDDSILNTGMGSQSFGTTKVAQQQTLKREESKQVKHENLNKLKPAGELVKEYIDTELASLKDLSTLDMNVVADSLKAEVMGREIARQRIETFKTKILNALRES